MSLFLELKNKNNKKLIYSLRDIYGLGLSTSNNICKTLGYDKNIRINALRIEDFNKLASIVNIKYKYIIGSELKKTIFDRIQNMKSIKSYKGVRHSYNMPVNGQRTHTNAKTRG